MLTAREVARSAQSLICLLQSFVGQRVQLELRDDTYALGVLKGVDSFMNVELSNARIWPIYAMLDDIVSDTNDGFVKEIVINTNQLPSEQWLSRYHKFDYLFIKGSRIRYFHIPNGTNINANMEQQISMYRDRRKTSQKPFNWKTYRKKIKLEEANQQQKLQN